MHEEREPPNLDDVRETLRERDEQREQDEPEEPEEQEDEED
jgi:hypothetical protein